MYQSVSRQRSGSVLAVIVVYPVTDSADGADPLHLVRVIELAAEGADMHVDHVRHRQELILPDMLGNHRPGKDAVRVAHQVLQDAELLIRQRKLLLAAPD